MLIRICEPTRQHGAATRTSPVGVLCEVNTGALEKQRTTASVVSFSEISDERAA